MLRSLTNAPLQARLSLKFAEDSGTTRLVERDHFGPLLVQKPLYPEGREVCQVVIIHPPGGVVGGDELEISARVGESALAQITTPGAAKWYKANGHVSRQNIRLHVDTRGSLEWAPQETIFFDNARVALDHQVTLEKEAVYIGCEILCFGRTASGESFTGGQIRQRTSIRRDGKLIWFEQLRLLGGSPAMKGSLALSGRTVCATLISTGKAVPGTLIDSAREEADEIANGAGHIGVSQLKSVVVARYLGDSSETARRIMLHIWGLLRPAMLGRPAIVPRMWNT
ncbi:urease accessory protein UreD [Nitrosovibrio sp. Nv6]|uniref:urease accessory protein UreD n=1 Tax=Nitrosovibrio sp. Nv6 TaxID=1855340 RepID=UPI0015A6BBF0|nr:urease accessory protein UreD [Nitrosovibrio sp. Nv6]